ncbi:MAG TPA: hypothetical protein VLS49_06750 [Usitatibacter sp.]|nr:hypothetical protein [Usitatibacter sp.]
MRSKVHWFRREAPKAPREVAGALVLVAWAAARRMVGALRKAGFDIEAGPGYFAFLFEALAFQIQIAWRVAYRRYGDEERIAFIDALARGTMRILAENIAELLGGDAREIEGALIADLNRRFEEYAEFAHDETGPSFAFLRYFASLVHELLPEKDRAWIHDQLIAIEGPEAASSIAKGLDALLDTSPGQLERTGSLGE